MKALPAHIWDRKSKLGKGEPQVFDLLQQIDISASSIFLHSQNLMGGKFQAWSEMDFLIISKKAIIGVEVKAGKVTCIEGSWHVFSPNGKSVYSKNKSPLVQVSDALESFRTGWFKQNFGKQFSDLPFVKIAVLCSNHRPDFKDNCAPPELPHEFTVYEEDLTPETFKDFLNLAVQFHINNFHPKKNQELNTSSIKEIAYKMRPNFDVSYASTSALSALNEEQTQLTQEQYTVVDQFESFNRLLLDGGAGTGKTYLLIYSAMQEVSRGRTVAIISRSDLLLQFIIQKVDKSVACISLNDSEINLGGIIYDVLLVDEGQDLCNQLDIDLLDSLIKDGLEGGRWRWFADFENQFSSTAVIDPDCLSYLKDCTGNNSIFRLNHNVRNTPNIVSWLEGVCKARIGTTKVKGAGPEVNLITFSQLGDLFCGEELDTKFGEISLSESVLLFVNDDDLKGLPCRDRLSRSGCEVSEINAFKGLEAMFVFIIGLEKINDLDLLRDLAYKSVSRARNICFIVSNDTLVKSLRKMKKGQK